MEDKSIHRSASGKPIDMQKIILQNETIRAVGNMSVNARGDVINSNNKPVASRSAQVNKSYNKQIDKTVKDTPLISKNQAPPTSTAIDEKRIDEIAGFDEKPETGGLRNAINKARKNKKDEK